MSQKRGTAESSWRVMSRCWAILLRLQQGPASLEELISTVKQYVGDDAYGSQTTPAQQTKRFRHDLENLKKHFHIAIQYDRRPKKYRIQEREWPLLNLADAHLETLAFLEQAHTANTPGAWEVKRLVRQLLAWLPSDRQKVFEQYQRQRAMQVDWSLRDEEPIDPGVQALVQEACIQGRYLQFDYLSRRNEEEIPRQHYVQPWELRVNRRRHHVELWAFCEWRDAEEEGKRDLRRYQAYRLSRIVPGSVVILPKKIPALPPQGRRYTAVYDLHPRLIKYGLSTQDELIGDPTLTIQPNGWGRVEGETYSVFNLARELLYYGGNCRVIGGADLRAEMEKLVGALVEIYGDNQATK